ncbi:hypothetical protein LTV02_17975 [Nocardia yamanashiensis]|uniref:hypothetical protein n=1 Tax=Nocardia yamanashiensis TaxID=209247 RepID=UPI001E4BDE75|nr:hypothetical protein [Nocardia yamanashiensis]UGT45160.1 hypothetical protein LTV02_17975 [Nocardia yamanashiensis]
MTDYLRSMAAYVATQNRHHHRDDRPVPGQVATPDIHADNPIGSADITDADAATELDRGWTR